MMSRLTRDETAEPVSRDQLSGANGDRGISIFPVQLTASRIDNLTRLIQTLRYAMTIHTYCVRPQDAASGVARARVPRGNGQPVSGGIPPRQASAWPFLYPFF